MTDVQVPVAPVNGNGEGKRSGRHAGGRQLLRRRGLPGGRAVVGGFLTAAAAVLVFAAYTSATAPPTQRYVVAAADLGPGEVIAPEHLRLTAIDLPDAMRARAFNAPEVLVGATTIAPLRTGELVQASAVVDRGGIGHDRVASFSADADRALNGTIKPGELVDVIVTYGTGESASTRLVVAAVPVITTGTAEGVVGSAAQVRFTVPVPDLGTELALAHAAAVGSITVVRTIADPGAADAPIYRPADLDAAAAEAAAEGSD